MKPPPWIYSQKVKSLFLHPKNYLHGAESSFPHDAKGTAGNPICGDEMTMYIRVKNQKITAIRWKTYGCASAIAATSALSELARGKTLTAALKITPQQIVTYLDGLPKQKFHCSVLGNAALAAAIKSYRTQLIKK
jgi:nitrogen fixation NifU-like protein